MASYGYMTVNGKRQGLISAGCSTQDSIGNKCQVGHIDEIMVLSLNHRLMNIGNIKHATHQPIQITKNVDKSSPLLAQALTSREELECSINLYRPSGQGVLEMYYTIQIKGAQLAELILEVPHAVLLNETEPTELISLRYNSITWTHHLAGTSGYCLWSEHE